MRMRFLQMVLFLLFLLGRVSLAQQFEWSAGIDGFLDNREYFSIDRPQTMFGSRAKAEIGFSMEGRHRMRFGLDYLYEFGQQPGTHPPGITLYYSYRAEHTDFRIGAFPRNGLLNYPIALLSDTLQYYRPNVEGAYLGFRGGWGRQLFFIDWTSRQTDYRYERFIFGFSGHLERGILFLDHHFLMGHFADRGIPDPEHHLRDNGGFHIATGMTLNKVLFLDSLTVSGGALVSLDRTRGVDAGWQTPAGFMGQLSANYRWLGLHGLCYLGKGHTFLYGDPFYQLGEYGRIDLSFMPFNNANVQLKFIVGIHFAAQQLDYSQQVILSMSLGGSRTFLKD